MAFANHKHYQQIIITIATIDSSQSTITAKYKNDDCKSVLNWADTHITNYCIRTTNQHRLCTVCGIDIDLCDTSIPYEKYDDAPGFTVCESITDPCNLKDILSTLNNPSSISLAIYYDDNGNYKDIEIEIEYYQPDNAYENLSFTLSGNGKYILSMSYSNMPK